MKLKNYALLCLVALMAITACKKHSTPKIDTDVYLVGEVRVNSHNVVASYKNGVITQLSDPTKNCTATGITVSGADVYVSGFYVSTGLNGGLIDTAVYWKNTTETRLITTGDIASAATAIGVNSSGNVYVSGSALDVDNNHSVNSHAAYWKDGVQKNLTTGTNAGDNSGAFGLALSGSNVYIAGKINDSATYWKDEVPTTLDDTTTSSASSIAVKGTDVYIGGTSSSANLTLFPYPRAVVWKSNGTSSTETKLTNGSKNAGVTAVAVDDSNNVYAAGYNNPTGTSNEATYWKNSIPTSFGEGEFVGISLVSNDVYTLGTTEAAAGYGYWKNNVFKQPLTEFYQVKGIVVVTHVQ